MKTNQSNIEIKITSNIAIREFPGISNGHQPPLAKVKNSIFECFCLRKHPVRSTLRLYN